VQSKPFIYSNVKGGECMGFILSLLEVIAKAIVKVLITTLTKHVVSRIKERTAPIDSRDGSDAVK